MGFSDGLVAEVSTHPVHMLNSNGSLMPSAFIPYCSFGENLAFLGEYVNNMTFPVCNMFQPTAFKGHLCYSLEISKMLITKRDNFQGKESGLMMIFDMNRHKSLEIPTNKQHLTSRNFDEKLSFSGAPKNHDRLARIHIGTLAPFTGFGPGDYKLSSLKQIKGTDNFLAKHKNEKKCTNEKFSKCQMRKAAEQNSICDCKLFELSSLFSSKKVIINFC